MLDEARNGREARSLHCRALITHHSDRDAPPLYLVYRSPISLLIVLLNTSSWLFTVSRPTQQYLPPHLHPMSKRQTQAKLQPGGSHSHTVPAGKHVPSEHGSHSRMPVHVLICVQGNLLFNSSVWWSLTVCAQTDLCTWVDTLLYYLKING